MSSKTQQLKWVYGLKAFAILAILLNHLIEARGFSPWFSNPSYNWLPLEDRLQNLLPHAENIPLKIVAFIGWLGDMGPGIFILLSGFTLTLSSLKKHENKIKPIPFYKKRLIRILPLYIAIHLIVLLGAEFLGRSEVPLTSPQVFLSLIGLRFTENLFFFLNPSWWFIWLIFQLYIVFPLLFRMLNKYSVVWFVGITLSFTLLSRLLGLLHLTYANDLYYWMTGLFFGTRLFEFTLGMLFAKLFIESEGTFILKLKTNKLLIYSGITYVIGFAASLFYISTLISNILITLGMSGLFLVLWRWVEALIPKSQNWLIWIGKVSFPVFLVHQSFMIWAKDWFDGNKLLIVLVFIAIVSFPLGRIIEVIINKVLDWLSNRKEKLLTKPFSWLIAATILIQLILNVSNEIIDIPHLGQLMVLVFVLNIFVIGIILFYGWNKVKIVTSRFLLFYLIFSIIFTFFLTPNWMIVYWLGFIVLALSFFWTKLTRPKGFLSQLIFTLVFVVLIGGGIERKFDYQNPLEAGRWGEYPVLQKDSNTYYSLKPNTWAKLKYNNYNYHIETNSLGFNSPEIDLNQKDTNTFRAFVVGDAFSMPEGMPYTEAYPYLLEQKLQRKYPNKTIQIVNAGVTGYGPNEMYACISKYVDIVKPDLIINQIFLNELLEVNTTKEDRWKEIGLYNMTLREKWFAHSQIPVQYQKFVTSLVPSKRFKANYNKSLAPLYEKNSVFYSEATIMKLEEYFHKLGQIQVKNQTPILVMYVPGQLAVSKPEYIKHYPAGIILSDTSFFDLNLANSIFKELCLNNELNYFDLTNILKNHPMQPVYFPESWHWNEEGHKVVSEFLADKVKTYIK